MTMTPEDALALLCDAEGVVQTVLYKNCGGALFGIGQYFGEAFEARESEGCREFLRVLRERGAAFNWPLQLAGAQPDTSMRFSASTTANGFFVVAAATRAGVTEMYERYLPLADETLRTREVVSVASMPSGERELYNELAHLNNELVTAQRELIKRNIELEKLNEFKNQFIGIAAHDLRNPLQVIDGYSQLLLDKIFGELNAEQHQFISVIRKNSDFMLKLITDMLHISRIDAGKLHLDLQPNDLSTLLQKNLELSRILADKKQITIRFECREELPMLSIDAYKIEQVLNNLISNAVKFSHPGTTVEVSLARTKTDALVSIRDQGQGIPADEIERLFIPFENLSVKSTGGEPSTGLGLAIVKRIIEGHGGKIRAESEVGVGSVFRFSLPLSTD